MDGVRELVENHTLRIPFVASADNLADFFTKPLRGRAFFPLRDIIMNVPLASRESGVGLRGGIESRGRSGRKPRKA